MRELCIFTLYMFKLYYILRKYLCVHRELRESILMRGGPQRVMLVGGWCQKLVCGCCGVCV